MAKKRKPINDKDTMRDHYDFSKLKWVRNPFAGKIKHPITVRIEDGSRVYYKQLPEEHRMPAQKPRAKREP